jgi:ketosteroid isomerase-like protein
MGHPNEDLIRRSYDAFSRGDMDTLRELLHPDIIWHAPPAAADWPATTRALTERPDAGGQQHLGVPRSGRQGHRGVTVLG